MVYPYIAFLALLSISLLGCSSANSPNYDEISSSSERSSYSQKSSSSSYSKYHVDPSQVVKGSFTDERDGHVYKTVKIGPQTWMAENLNYAYNEPTADLDSSSFCYEDQPDSCAKYGRLYLWSAAMDSAEVFSKSSKGCCYGDTIREWDLSPQWEPIRGVCPEGWHMPNDFELNVLAKATKDDGEDYAGLNLKAKGAWYDEELDDPYGFSLLPAGFRDTLDMYLLAGDESYLWSTSVPLRYYGLEDDWNYASAWKSMFKRAYFGTLPYTKKFGLSVRCVKNYEGSEMDYIYRDTVGIVDPSSVEKGSMTDDRDGQVYKTVKIGAQIWMAENLNYAYKQKTTSLDSSSFCLNHDPKNCKKYGRLYLRSAALDSVGLFSETGLNCGEYYDPECRSQDSDPDEDVINMRGACPQGWHVPNDIEWNDLRAAVGGNRGMGNTLRSATGWDHEGEWLDAYGFSVIPSGIYRSIEGNFVEGLAYFWSSSKADNTWNLSPYDAIHTWDCNKGTAKSIRCIKD